MFLVQISVRQIKGTGKFQTPFEIESLREFFSYYLNSISFPFLFWIHSMKTPIGKYYNLYGCKKQVYEQKRKKGGEPWIPNQSGFQREHKHQDLDSRNQSSEIEFELREEIQTSTMFPTR